MATSGRSPYTGNYTLRVVFTQSEIEAGHGRFTDDEIHKYNNMDRFAL